MAEDKNAAPEKKKAAPIVKIFNVFLVILFIVAAVSFFYKSDDKSSTPQPAAPTQSSQTAAPVQPNNQPTTQPQKTMEERIAAAQAAMALDENAPQESPAERAARRAMLVKRTIPVQAEIKALYDELLAMRGTREFIELGYSGNNKCSSAWKNEVEALRDRMEKDSDLPIEVRVAPGHMLGLGLSKKWRAGKNTSDSKFDAQMVKDALNWKMPEDYSIGAP